MKVAFYAPMKSPNHPTPSGDRRMARLLMQALDRAGFETELASELRNYDGKGDKVAQNNHVQAATSETAALLGRMDRNRPDLWFTYHCYYKAPDLVGPRVAEQFGIPYVIAEPSRASKRLDGPWSRFAEEAEAAIDAASVVFAMTDHDRFALDRDRIAGQQIVDFPPFLEPGPEPARLQHDGPVRLLTVAMMRQGAKLASYRILADALALLKINWSLTIVGDGPARAEAETLFASFSKRVTFHGAEEDENNLRTLYEQADLFVWPGVDEAYGMVYLEAQAAGLAVVAENRPGPCSVIAPSCALTAPSDPRAYADAISDLANQPEAGFAARKYVLARHSLDSAAMILRKSLT